MSDWYLANYERMPQQQIDALPRLSTATIYEANERRGAIDPSIRQIVPGVNLCGSAVTVRCQPGDNLTLHAAVALAQAGDVLVADVGDHLDAGHWGEILTVAARARGLSGLVINGSVRDVAALAKWGVPVFARGVCMKATTKQIRGLINHPITCGEVRVHPGDIVFGDEDGVVVVPCQDVERVLRAGQEREEAEAGTMKRLQEGELTLDILNMRALIGPVDDRS